jgi:hypothetical protein
VGFCLTLAEIKTQVLIMTGRLVGLIRRLTIFYVCGCVGIRIVKK